MKTLLNKFYTFQSFFDLDLRSLSLMRILIGIMIIVDCLYRMQSLVPHYTDVGIVPRSAISNYNFGWYISLYNITGNSFFVLVLFIINIIFAFLLIIGYRTKFVTFMCWFFHLSLFYRNPFVNAGSDNFFKIILFWSIFLPLGLKYSVDSVINPVKEKVGKTVYTISTMGYTIQILCLYFFAGLYKLRPVWIIEGQGVYYSLMYIPFKQAVGDFLLDFPLVLKFLSYLTVVFELSVPLLILFPFKRYLVRSVTILLLVFMHIAFGFSIELGMFSYFAIACIIGLLTPWFWDRLTDLLKTIFKNHSHITIYTKHTSNNLIYFLKTFLILEKISIKSFTSLPDNILQDSSSKAFIIKVNQKFVTNQLEAFLQIMRNSPIVFFIPFFYTFPILKISILMIVKLFSYLFFLKTTFVHIVSTIKKIYLNRRFVTKFLLTSLIFYTLFINISGIRRLHINLPSAAYIPASLLGFTQRWTLFTPPPYISNLLFATGTTSSRKEVMLTKNYKADQDLYNFPSDAHPTHHWKKLSESILKGNVQREFSDYLCRAWQLSYPEDPLVIVHLHHRKITTLLDRSYSAPEDTIIYQYYCIEKKGSRPQN